MPVNPGITMSGLLQLATAAEQVEPGGVNGSMCNILESHLLAGTDPEVHEDPQFMRRYTTSTSSYYGLPYQDHNYGAPPPPTPPPSPPRSTSPEVPKLNSHVDIEEASETVITSALPEVKDELMCDTITRCVCGFDHDDGFMICCDKCSVWQHIDCMYDDKTKIPDTDYYCERCEPRTVDRARAVQIQTTKLQDKSDSSSDSDIETVYAATATTPATVVVTSKKTKKIKKVRRLDATGAVTSSSKILLKKHRRNSVKKEGKKDDKIKPRKPRSRSMEGGLKVKIVKTKNSRKSILCGDSQALNDVINSVVDRYEEANSNQFSAEILKIIASQEFRDTVGNMAPSSSQLQVQMCQVHEFKTGKGLEATETIVTNQILIECKGTFMMQWEYERENDIFERFHSYVLFYELNVGNICLNSSSYGNEARFVRRSCTPNAQVKHIAEGSELHLFIYSSNSISKGAEITIPFDFNYKQCKYKVQCACSRVNCPVAKFNKSLDKEIGKPKLLRKKRSSKSKDEMLVDVDVKTENVLPQPVPPVKRRRHLSPVKPLSPLKTALKQPTVMSLSPPLQLVKQLQSPPAVSPNDESSQNTGNVHLEDMLPGETQAEAQERRKKMTREERKMEAIVEAFKKLERREERRKEALARIESTKFNPSNKPTETTIEVPATEVIVEKKETRPKIKRRKPSTPSRRNRSRMSSGNSDMLMSPDDNSNTSTPALSTGTPLLSSDIVTPGLEKAFKFPKTKKYMMNEWLSEKSDDVSRPLHIKTDTYDEAVTNFVKCVPSPHMNSLDHIRRNSMGNSFNSSRGSTVGASLDTSLGSAKKRWLRQAMCETTSSESSLSKPNENSSPSRHSDSPTSAPSPSHSPPVDFITPLKKRRLARESLSADFPPTPVSSPSSSRVFSSVVTQTSSSNSSQQNVVKPETLVTSAKSDPSTERNGYIPTHTLPPTPRTPNLFENFSMGSYRLEAIQHQESVESDVSETLLRLRSSMDSDTESITTNTNITSSSSTGLSLSSGLKNTENTNNDAVTSSSANNTARKETAIDHRLNSTDSELRTSVTDDSRMEIDSPSSVSSLNANLVSHSSNIELADSSSFCTKKVAESEGVSSSKLTEESSCKRDDSVVECSSSFSKGASLETTDTVQSSQEIPVVDLTQQLSCDGSSAVDTTEIHSQQTQNGVDSTVVIDLSDDNGAKPADSTITSSVGSAADSLIPITVEDINTASSTTDDGLRLRRLHPLNQRSSASAVNSATASTTNTSLPVTSTPSTCVNTTTPTLQPNSNSVMDRLNLEADSSSLSLREQTTARTDEQKQASNDVDSSDMFLATNIINATAHTIGMSGVSSSVTDTSTYCNRNAPVMPTTVQDEMNISSSDNNTGSVQHNTESDATPSSSETATFQDRMDRCSDVVGVMSNVVGEFEQHASQVAAQQPKKKVSLLEYRKRVKERQSVGEARTPSKPSTPTRSISSPVLLATTPRHGTPTLAPLPLFNNPSPGRDCDFERASMRGPGDVFGRDSSDVEQPTSSTQEKREKPLSLSERLKMEFGLDSDEDDQEADKSPSSSHGSGHSLPPPPPPSDPHPGQHADGPVAINGIVPAVPSQYVQLPQGYTGAFQAQGSQPYVAQAQGYPGPAQGYTPGQTQYVTHNGLAIPPQQNGVNQGPHFAMKHPYSGAAPPSGGPSVSTTSHYPHQAPATPTPFNQEQYGHVNMNGGSSVPPLLSLSTVQPMANKSRTQSPQPSGYHPSVVNYNHGRSKPFYNK